MATESKLTAGELPSLFSDLTPVPQDDGPYSVCVIDYSQEFIQAYDYMRAVLKAEEKSERALRLTALCLKLNPANYTIWHFRRECLKALGGIDSSRIQGDLQLAADLGGSNPKNYQLWHHRRALVEPIVTEKQDGFLEMVDKELAYVASVLDSDGKNYHAWSYRQWIVRTVNEEKLWLQEMEYAHSLILQDARNNSAWNQRWFASHRGMLQPLQLEDAQKEADYAIQGANLDPYNESPWRYLIGIVKEQVNTAKSNPDSTADTAALVDEFERKSFELRNVLENAGRDPDGCANMASARIDLLEFKGDSASLQTAAGLAMGLATEHDTIRKKYWLLREKEIQDTLANP